VTDLVVPEPREIANPATGEVISKDDVPACAKALDEIREMEWKLKQAKAWLTEAFVEEAARQGSKTLRFPGVDIVLGSDRETEWDVTELVKLLDLGLPPARYAELVKEEVTYKVSAREATRIEKANPDYAKVIERAKTVVEKKPYAKVTLT
jgi:hypothetical protein